MANELMTLIERLRNPQRLDGGVIDAAVAERVMDEAADALEQRAEWQGCSHLDCLPECTIKLEGGHCERWARFKANDF